MTLHFFILTYFFLNFGILLIALLLKGLDYCFSQNSPKWNYFLIKASLFSIFFIFFPISSYYFEDWSYTRIDYLDNPDFKISFSMKIPYAEYLDSPFSAILVILFVFVIFISVLLLIRYIYLLHRVRRYALTNCIQSKQLDEQIKKLSSMKILVYLNPNLHSAMVVGIFHPFIVMNQIHDEKECSFILMHELEHIQKRDHLVNFIWQIFSIFYWYNPLIYYLRYQLNLNCELACDERVVKNLSKKERISYYQLLVDCARDSSSTYNKKLNLTFLSSSTKIFERRILQMESNKSKFKNTLISILACLMFFAIMPITIDASIESFSNYYLEKFENKDRTIIQTELSNYKFRPYDEKHDENKQIIEILSLARGKNTINEELAPSNLYLYGNMHLEKGTKVELKLITFDEGEFSFIFGNEEIKSIEGTIVEEFKITESDTYRIMIKNLSDASITITGYIDIQS